MVYYWWHHEATQPKQGGRCSTFWVDMFWYSISLYSYELGGCWLWEIMGVYGLGMSGLVVLSFLLNLAINVMGCLFLFERRRMRGWGGGKK